MAGGDVTVDRPLAHSVDRCVQCGFCLPACPTYRLFEREQSSPRGRIALARAISAGEVEATSETLATYEECVGCRACEPACPSGVLYEEVLLYGREQLAEVSDDSPLEVRALLWFIRTPARLAAARLAWRAGGRAAPRLARALRRRPQLLGLLAALPSPGSAPLAPETAPSDVLVHRGCIMDVFWEGTNARAVQLLRGAGVRAGRLPSHAGCCGALHAHQGKTDTARRLARRNIETWEQSGSPDVVSLAGGCGAFMRGYGELFPPGDGWHERAARLGASVRDISSLLVETGWTGHTVATRTTYQDSCHLRNGLGVWAEPRALLAAVSDLSELPGASICCGSAGVYNLVRPDVANRLLDEKVEAIRALGAEEVVTANPGCELQLRLGLMRHGVPARVRHLVDFLYEHASGE